MFSVARSGVLMKLRRRPGSLILAPLCICAALPSTYAQTSEPCEKIPTGSHDLVATADCYQRSGEAARALDALLAALDGAPAGPEGAAERIAIQDRLGQVYAALGDYQHALDSLNGGIEAARAAGRSDAAAPLLNDLGGLYMALDEPLQGLAAFADSARLATRPGALALTARVNLARALAETDAVDDLRGRLDELGGEAAQLDDRRSGASILLSLAELYRTLPARASPDVRRIARGLAADALASAQQLGDPRLTADAYGQLGLSAADAGALDRALESMRAAVSIAQRAGASASLYRWEWQSGRVLRAMGKQADALAAYRTAIDTLGSTQAALVTSRRGFRRDILPLYEEYADLELRSTRGLDPADAHAALSDVQQTLEKLRVAEVRNYFENQCAVPQVFDPAQGLSPGVLVIYPVLFADRVELLVSTGKELFQFTSNVSLAELTEEAGSLRQSIEDSSSGDAYLAPAERLYDWLIRPLEGVLREASPHTLVFVPDGILRTIPLAVLHDGKQFLVERYSLATTPALSLIGTVNAAPVMRVLANGITQPVRGFSALPFVATELHNVEQTFPSRVYEDQGFRTPTLEREIVSGGYSIVHMATHAQFESDYRRSFLLAYDGLITMDELENIVGSQRYTDHPVDLLVLSACQTAAGDERAALGLAGVAVKAGARSVLASLWLINDESTAQLVSEFYRELADPAKSKADALRGAQLLLMNDAAHRHPAYWAPFLLIGDWR